MSQPVKLSGLNVTHVMSPNVIFVNENDSVSFVIKIFDRCHISGAPVENKTGEYVGVISKTDLFDRSVLEYMEKHGGLNELPVRSIMNPTRPLSVDEMTSVEKAAEVMLTNHVHRVFVTSKGRIIGVVSSYDILKVVASADDATEQAEADERGQRLLDIRAQLQKKSMKNNR